MEAEQLLDCELRAKLPLARQVLLYLDPFAFFKDASRGTAVVRERNLSYNRGMRWVLVPYLRRWLLITAVLFMGIAPAEAMAAQASLAIVPAALAVTRERFVVYSSNAFAILGLRSLYLVLARTIASLRYLHYGLAFVLAFAGVKMIVHDWVKIPPLLSVAIITLAITVAVLASLRGRRERAALMRERQAH